MASSPVNMLGAPESVLFFAATRCELSPPATRLQRKRCGLFKLGTQGIYDLGCYGREEETLSMFGDAESYVVNKMSPNTTLCHSCFRLLNRLNCTFCGMVLNVCRSQAEDLRCDISMLLVLLLRVVWSRTVTLSRVVKDYCRSTLSRVVKDYCCFTCRVVKDQCCFTLSRVVKDYCCCLEFVWSRYFELSVLMCPDLSGGQCGC